MKKSTKRERLVWLGWLLVGIGAAALGLVGTLVGSSWRRSRLKLFWLYFAPLRGVYTEFGTDPSKNEGSFPGATMRTAMVLSCSAASPEPVIRYSSGMSSSSPSNYLSHLSLATRTYVSAKRGAALKAACCIRHWQRFAAFPVVSADAHPVWGRPLILT